MIYKTFISNSQHLFLKKLLIAASSSLRLKNINREMFWYNHIIYNHIERKKEFYCNKKRLESLRCTCLLLCLKIYAILKKVVFCRNSFQIFYTLKKKKKFNFWKRSFIKVYFKKFGMHIFLKR